MIWFLFLKYDEHCKIFVSSRISTWREKKVDKNLYLFLHVHICTREFEFDQSLGFFSFSFAIKSIIFIGSAKIHQEKFDFAIIFFGYCFEAKNIVNYYYRLVPWPQFERSCFIQFKCNEDVSVGTIYINTIHEFQFQRIWIFIQTTKRWRSMVLYEKLAFAASTVINLTEHLITNLTFSIFARYLWGCK